MLNMCCVEMMLSVSIEYSMNLGLSVCVHSPFEPFLHFHFPVCLSVLLFIHAQESCSSHLPVYFFDYAVTAGVIYELLDTAKRAEGSTVTRIPRK